MNDDCEKCHEHYLDCICACVEEMNEEVLKYWFCGQMGQKTTQSSTPTLLS